MFNITFSPNIVFISDSCKNIVIRICYQRVLNIEGSDKNLFIIRHHHNTVQNMVWYYRQHKALPAVYLTELAHEIFEQKYYSHLNNKLDWNTLFSYFSKKYYYLGTTKFIRKTISLLQNWKAGLLNSSQINRINCIIIHKIAKFVTFCSIWEFSTHFQSGQDTYQFSTCTVPT